jgi:phosphate/phosphite/phosphonate ABC transporter binding protein
MRRIPARDTGFPPGKMNTALVPRNPELIGRYRILDRLATGGMAEIFLACEQGTAGLRRLVVIKRILPHLAADPSYVDMFRREARIMAGLSHPNVVQIIELGDDGGQDFIALEYIHGLTAQELHALAAEEGTGLPVGVAVSVVMQACRGLHAAHEMRDLADQHMELVHRDASPNNLMITADGHVKIVDFGIAKPTAVDDSATYDGALKGKWAYMSPEQCRNEPLDRRSDIFTLGIVLWELCTGLRLFKRDNEMEMMNAVIEGPIPLPGEQNPAVTPLLELVIFKALERRREERFETAEEMRSALIEAAEIDELDVGDDVLATYVAAHAGALLEDRRKRLTRALSESLSGDWPLPPPGLRFETESTEVPTVVSRPKRTPSTSPAVAEGAPGASAPHADGDGDGADADLDEPHDPHDPVAALAEKTERSRQGLMLGAFVGAVVIAGLVATTLLPDPPDKPAHATEIHLASTDGSGTVASLRDPLRIGWPPFEAAENLVAEAAPLERYLEEQLQRPVEQLVCADYDSCGERLRSGELDAVFLSPALYVTNHALEPALVPLGIRRYDGATTYDSVLVVRSDSAFENLESLRGHRFCLTDRGSTSGDVLPRVFLAERGYDPDAFMGEVTWSGTHPRAIADLLAERCDVAATNSGALYSAFARGQSVGGLRVLATTGITPRDALVAGPRLAEDVRERLGELLLSFDPQVVLGVDRIGATLRLTGFAAVDDADYDRLRAVLSEWGASEPARLPEP